MTHATLPQEQRGPAERLLDVVLNASAHLWHNRPGFNVGGKWVPAKGHRGAGEKVAPGLFVPAAENLYGRLLDIYGLNNDLMAHFSSYALTKTDWRDLKVACAALMLVQPRSGQPVMDDDGSVGFYDDDLRLIGEAMVLHYERKSVRMMTPKAVLRVAQLLEMPEIAELNRTAGFVDASSRKPALGRWPKVAAKWLAYREANPAMLEGLVKAGYKETIKNIARKVGYKPLSERFFAVLGWKQKQAEDGHRALGLDGLELQKTERFDGLSEAEICETIVSGRLSHKDVMGRLPADIGLTPAIMVALLPTLSDRDLRQLTPTLEELGLMTDPDVRAAWEKAIESATDQRGLNIAKNVQSVDLRHRLEASADAAARNAVKEATGEQDIHVMFLIDRSGSMQGALQKSVEALSRILAGFPADKLHIASFDTMGLVHVPKASSRVAVAHMLSGVSAGGGTMHIAAVPALSSAGAVVPKEAKLIVFVVGDEAGEQGARFAQCFADEGYRVDAMALILNVAYGRGRTVTDCARALRVPFSVVEVEQFDDPYQVPRVLQAVLEAPPPSADGVVKQTAWVEKVMSTPLLQLT
ncbi:MAG: VWA domain-containing protein [Nannocystaceae bacterium]|nr:VWA domain-containing protein [Nannocystaceae bacterium]